MAVSSRKNSVQGWQPLKKGDLVDLISPGYRTADVDLENAVRFLESWGLRARVPKKIYGKDLLSSNNDNARFEHLEKALTAKDSQAIWCIRGGYGSNRLIERLAKVRAQKPKLFIGLSDITSLHVFVNQKWGWPTVHGPLLDRLGKKAALPKFEAEMKKFVFGDIQQIEFKALRPLNEAAKKEATIKGPVTGGNLIVLQSTLMTAGSWDPSKKIVFFEEIGERGYRIDRALEQFRQAGLFKQAKAVIFGQFTHGDEPDGRNLILPVMKRFADSVSFPVLNGLPSGHDVIQRPVPFETSSILKTGSRGSLVCKTGVQL